MRRSEQWALAAIFTEVTFTAFEKGHWGTIIIAAIAIIMNFYEQGPAERES